MYWVHPDAGVVMKELKKHYLMCFLNHLLLIGPGPTFALFCRLQHTRIIVEGGNNVVAWHKGEKGHQTILSSPSRLYNMGTIDKKKQEEA